VTVLALPGLELFGLPPPKIQEVNIDAIVMV